MLVRHNYSLLNLIVPAETGALDHLQTSIFSCLELIVQHDLCLISDKHCTFIKFCWVLCSGVMISSTKTAHWHSRLTMVHGWNGSHLLCRIFYKIGCALWASMSKNWNWTIVALHIAHVRHRPSLGQTQKKQKLQQLQPCSIQLCINSSSPHVHKGGLAKHQNNKQNDKPFQTKHRKCTSKQNNKFQHSKTP